MIIWSPHKRTNVQVNTYVQLYMKQVIVRFQFQRATRTRNWFLHLAALKKLISSPTVDWVMHIARMQELETADPTPWTEFLSGNFTVNTSNSEPFTRISVEQGLQEAMEHLNEITQGKGGECGITLNPLLQF